jgi:hypothetical protein
VYRRVAGEPGEEGTQPVHAILGLDAVTHHADLAGAEGPLDLAQV